MSKTWARTLERLSRPTIFGPEGFDSGGFETVGALSAAGLAFTVLALVLAVGFALFAVLPDVLEAVMAFPISKSALRARADPL
ncbi:MAG: hypothetical protein V3U82_03875 [Robiginitomaculum sp.]